jgi:hypothetical protein
MEPHEDNALMGRSTLEDQIAEVLVVGQQHIAPFTRDAQHLLVIGTLVFFADVVDHMSGSGERRNDVRFNAFVRDETHDLRDQSA